MQNLRGLSAEMANRDRRGAHRQHSRTSLSVPWLLRDLAGRPSGRAEPGVRRYLRAPFTPGPLLAAKSTPAATPHSPEGRKAASGGAMAICAALPPVGRHS
jgi:hypothetical protein